MTKLFSIPADELSKIYSTLREITFDDPFMYAQSPSAALAYRQDQRRIETTHKDAIEFEISCEGYESKDFGFQREILDLMKGFSSGSDMAFKMRHLGFELERGRAGLLVVSFGYKPGCKYENGARYNIDNIAREVIIRGLAREEKPVFAMANYSLMGIKRLDEKGLEEIIKKLQKK